LLSIVHGGTTLRLLRSDITEQETDAIVNAANSSLLGGGGVDGAIHHAGGPQILEECKAIRKQQGECPPGSAVLTGGGYLKARFVIHAVGPVWRGGNQNEDHLLASAYKNSLAIAIRNDIRTISFPSISTGTYWFPVERAAEIALNAVLRFLDTCVGIDEVRFITFSQPDYETYARLFTSLSRSQRQKQESS
jgi:O-acetyl-ADP-ribose deacetylase (regulator of RNase III)